MPFILFLRFRNFSNKKMKQHSSVNWFSTAVKFQYRTGENSKLGLSGKFSLVIWS